MQLSALGVSAAFEVLLRRHRAAVRSYCARLCGSGLGDEAAQETFLTLWQERESYEPRGRFRAYLFTIAQRRCHNALRGSKRQRRVAEAAQALPSASVDADELLARERQRRLYERVHTLPEEQRQAILLHFAADLPYEEIAALTGRPAATIRTRVFSGLGKLRKLLGQGGEP